MYLNVYYFNKIIYKSVILVNGVWMLEKLSIFSKTEAKSRKKNDLKGKLIFNTFIQQQPRCSDINFRLYKQKI